jgi:outer membrane immunogenic protein
MAVMLMTVMSFAQYQPAVELTGNYHFTHLTLPAGLGSTNMPAGFGTTVNVPINNWFGVVGDFGRFSKSNSLTMGGVSASGDLTILTFGGGPRFTYRTRSAWQPYFQFVLGGAHLTASGSIQGFGSSSSGTTAFMIAPGGGVQFKMSRSIWLNTGFNYLRASKYGYAINGFQPTVGVSFHFGGPVAR